ncbi:hypothetical protein M5K25_026647 [Dendrobium thyrsiflorum]|uniref:Uncharacterized protein n=1 Tax=Dendrobium thyrsiflorum TaxID=117978 RepID=A0ABD0TY63_DENTH
MLMYYTQLLSIFIREGLVEYINIVSGPLPSPWSGEKGRRVLCPHRGVVKKEELRFSAGERKKGSLPSPWSGEKGKSCDSLPGKGRRVLCPHRGVVKKEELRFSAGGRKTGSLPSPCSGEKGRKIRL